MVKSIVEIIAISLAMATVGSMSCVSSAGTRNTEQWTESKSYDMKPVGARRMDDGKLIAVMRVTPKEPESFKLILSMKVGYGENRTTTAMDIQKPNSDGKIQIAIYGSDIAQKSANTYSVLEGKIDPDKLGDDRLLAFNFTGLIPDSADSLYLTYGLWEQKDMNQRVERTYGFKIDPAMK